MIKEMCKNLTCCTITDAMSKLSCNLRYLTLSAYQIIWLFYERFFFSRTAEDYKQMNIVMHIREEVHGGHEKSFIRHSIYMSKPC